MDNFFSSWIKFTKTENVEEIKELEEKKFPIESEKSEIFIDWGEEIPDYYNKNYLRILYQDPYRIFVYWELDIDTISKYFNDMGNKLILKMHNLTDNITININVGNATSWWVHTTPDKKYRATLVVKRENGEEIQLLRSKTIETPRDCIYWKTDEHKIFSRENLNFFELFTISGALPINWDFLEKLKNYPWDEPLFKVPEILLRYLPLWLKLILRQLNLTIPLSFFIEYILKVYFPQELHSIILSGENIDVEKLEEILKTKGYDFTLPIQSSSSSNMKK